MLRRRRIVRKPIRRRTVRKPIRRRTIRRRRNPAGPLLMVNPVKSKRKSAKRVAAGKKAARTRKRNASKTVKRKPIKSRRKNPMAKRGRKSAKRVAAGRKAWRTRKRRKNPVKRRRKTTVRRRRRKNPIARRVTRRKRVVRRRRRNTWFKQPIRHRRAAKKGIRRRRTGRRKSPRTGRNIYLRTSRGRRYKKRTMYRGKYRSWNPASIRTRNPGAMDIILPVATGIGGLVLAGLLMKKLPVSITSKIPTVAGINLGVLIPAAAGVLAMKYLTKKIPKHSKIIYGLSFGLILASGMALYNTLLAPKLGLSAGLSGYVTTPFSGYVPARGAMAGYVRNSLGQLEQRLPGGWSSMGEPVQFFGARPQGMLPPGRAALNYQPLSSKPYGLGLPREERRYDDWNWSGVYDSSVYE